MTADIIIYNARIYTEDPDMPWAEAIAIEGKKIACVGRKDECMAYASESTELLDYEGKIIIPAFIDGHTHPTTVAKTYWAIRSDDLTRDIEKLMNNIKRHAEKYPKEERPYFYYESYFAETFGEEGPKKEDLDAVISDRPARIQEFGDHACWYNSMALEMLKGKDGKPYAESPIGEPFFKKDENGEYTGLALETVVAGDLGIFESIGWRPEEHVNDEIQKPFLDYLKHYGIMCIMDGFTEGEDSIEYFYELDKAGELGMFYDATSILENVSDIEDSIQRVRDWQDKYSGEHIRCNTIKYFIDGTNEHGDCLSTEPFANRPEEEYYGEAYATTQEIRDVLVRLNEEKIDFHVHTICDGSFRLMCDAVEEAQEICGSEWSIKVCLTHCEIIAPEDRDRVHELGIYIDWSTHWAGGYFGEEAQTFLGIDRWNTMYDFTTQIKAGEHVGFSSDVFSYQEADRANPFFGMQTSMTRVDPQFPLDPDKYPGSVRPPESAKLTLKQLIHGYTVTNAIRMRVDDIMGSLEKGKLANFIVLKDDIFEIAEKNPFKFKDIEPVCTFFEGKERRVPRPSFD